MKFRTELSHPVSQFQLDYHKPTLMMGSCFTENIGAELSRRLFPVIINPFGVTYNPMSIARGIGILLNKQAYTEKDLDQHNDLYFSFDHYTKFSAPTAAVALEKINTSFQHCREKIENLGYLILTFGTAYVYRHRSRNVIVNNCHKIPSREFNRDLLSISDIVDEYTGTIEVLKERWPDLKILLTVSPVRHLKDGMAGNQESKSILHLAARALVKSFPESCFYFPAYEIMMDDLRDYRYYDRDLVHPNSQATEYIWEHFREICVGEKAGRIIDELEPLLRDKAHRPLHQTTKEYMNFVSKRDENERKLREKYPFLNWVNFI